MSSLPRSYWEKNHPYTREDMDECVVDAYLKVIEALNLEPTQEGSSLHCFNKQYNIQGILVDFVWEYGGGDQPSGCFLKKNDWSHLPENPDEVDFMI